VCVRKCARVCVCMCAAEGTMINVVSKNDRKNEIGWINSPDSVGQAKKNEEEGNKKEKIVWERECERERKKQKQRKWKQKQAKFCFCFFGLTAKGQTAKTLYEKRKANIKKKKDNMNKKKKEWRSGEEQQQTVRKMPFINGKGIWNLVRKATKCCRPAIEREREREKERNKDIEIEQLRQSGKQFG